MENSIVQLLSAISPSELPAPYCDVTKAVSPEAALRLASHYQGIDIYFARLDDTVKNRCVKLICESESSAAVIPLELPAPYCDIAHKVNLETALYFANMYSGEHVCFPKLDSVIRIKRNEKIRNEFNGYNFQELAVKYNMTDRWVRLLVSRPFCPGRKSRNREIEGQVQLGEFL